MRTIVTVLALLTACIEERVLDSDSPELHTVALCVGWGANLGKNCETPCATHDADHPAYFEGGGGCLASFISPFTGQPILTTCSVGGPSVPPNEFSYAGVRGCCARHTGSDYIAFAVCDGQ